MSSPQPQPQPQPMHQATTEVPARCADEGTPEMLAATACAAVSTDASHAVAATLGGYLQEQEVLSQNSDGEQARIT